jgi:paraquat-inducible protein A
MNPHLLACHECDALQQQPVLEPGASAECWRCGGHLLRESRMNLERLLALAIAALILFALANAFPLFALDLQGTHRHTSLFGAVQTLWGQGMELVALLVMATTILVPLLQMIVLIYVLGVFLLGGEHEAPGLMLLLRAQALVRPWSMIEVFMLGALVSMVKLSHIVDIHVGVAIWSFGGVMLLLAAVTAQFDARQLWNQLEFRS